MADPSIRGALSAEPNSDTEAAYQTLQDEELNISDTELLLSTAEQAPVTSSSLHQASKSRFDHNQARNQQTFKSINSPEPIYDRPNRFNGPSSTWVSWTRSERETFKTLKQERDNDLAAHLLVANRIKRQAKDQKATSARARADKKGKPRAISTDYDESHKISDSSSVDESPFAPPNAWTAWPMPPEQVPRRSHVSGVLDDDDTFTFRAEADVRPSAELEACIIAAATRIARRRWQSRNSELEETIPAAPEAVQHESDNVARSKSPETAPATDDDDSPWPIFFSSQPVPNIDYTSNATSRGSPSEISDIPPMEINEELQDSQSPELDASDTELPALYWPPDMSFRPVPIADEDLARTLLLPATRRIIAAIDRLLTGLHKTRQPYASNEVKGWSRSQSRGRSQSRRRSGSRARSSGAAAREKIRSLSASVGMHIVDRDSDGDFSDERCRKRRRDDPPADPISRIRRLGLRDWTDVLGMASIMGWDGDVLARAGERCASLFGEKMEFQTINDPEDVKRSDGNLPEMKEWVVGDDVDADSDDTSEAKVGSDTMTENQTTDSEALDDEDDEDEDQISTSASDSESQSENEDDEGDDISEPSAPTKPIHTSLYPLREPTRPGPFPCPHMTCHRHKKPYTAKSHLARHLNRQHQSAKTTPRTTPAPAPASFRASSSHNLLLGPQKSPFPSPSAPSSSAASSPTASTTAPSQSQSQSPHSTANPNPTPQQYFCPVPSCIRHESGGRDPFSRGSLLYKHVRRMHPVVDVGRLKKGQTQRKRRASKKRRAS